MFTFGHIQGYLAYLYCYKICHIMFSLHVSDLSFEFGGGGVGGAVTGKKAARPSLRPLLTFVSTTAPPVQNMLIDFLVM